MEEIVNKQELEKKLSLGPEVKVLSYHPKGLIALEKPINVLSHPNMSMDKWRSLLKASYDAKRRCFYNLEGEDVYEKVYLIHRLDSGTSGVILVCTDRQIHEQAIKAFEKGRVKKVYNAIVKGKPKSIPPVWVDRLNKSNSGNQVRVGRHGGQSIAKTRHYCIQGDCNRAGLSLMKLAPETGRTHQLRYQCATRGFPILGDEAYGDFKLNKYFHKFVKFRRMFLHSHSIEISIVCGQERIELDIESPMPECFVDILKPDKNIQKMVKNLPTSNEDVIRLQRQRVMR